MSINRMYSKLLAVGVTCLLAGACTHQTAEVPATPTPTATSEAPEGVEAAADHSHTTKTYAPVTLELTSSARSGAATVVLTVTALADLPSAHARLVLPEGVSLLSASPEADLGAIAKGAQASFTARVQIPVEGSYTLAGGVEVKVGTGRQLAKSTVLAVGADARDAAATAPVIELPEGGSVRVGE
ncbi:MAG: hypothetical protein CVU56_21405 [Deltaproteobacteria bacterium HGW-Deltaproteobacteria-14]|jgi:hypothetical protein|nr:MAG: hypothetical protein CVU56_21405 [Deltaproteobacteria bacterium HGW-Deltaproteobacteria-14]